MSLRTLKDKRRALLIGMGGGGDVVGALALTPLVERLGSDWALGGVAWERTPIDPRPGPRSLEEIRGGRPCGSAALLAGPSTTSSDGIEFSESRMAGHLGRSVLLLDITRGPRAVAQGLAEAAAELDCDAIVLIDVGGDVLAHGHEPGLASPLCDAVLLAAASLIDGADGAPPVLGGIFGIGCDGELTAAEVAERLAEVAAAGGLAGARGLTPAVVERLEAAVAAVPTEASAQALRCFRGERGRVAIRDGLRTVELSPLGAATVFFDVGAALRSAARLALAVRGAADLEAANDALHGLGIRTELDRERRPPGALP